ncbi:MAG: AraC-like DNA-binding protein [Paracoccaceae bacterium]|jgi:AraC-like DNA-binding protein
MSSKSPQHGAIYVKTLAQSLLDQGYSDQQVFQGTGIDPTILNIEKPFAGFDQIATFFEQAAVLTGDDALGLTHGQNREMRRAGLICYVGLSSPTVLVSIKNMTRYRRVFSDAIELDHQSLEADGILRWHYSVPASLKRRQFVEFAASGLLRDLRRCANRRFTPDLVTFRHARNSNIPAFGQHFGCEVIFGAPDNSFRFQQADLALPLVTADDELYAILRKCCEEALMEKSANVPPVILDVERKIAERLAAGEANQKSVAKALGMSPRTLSRRLAHEGTTFFHVLEDLRRALAVSYLRDSNLVLAEIAFLLGYAGQSSFNDAFKRWTGQTPGQYRST